MSRHAGVRRLVCEWKRSTRLQGIGILMYYIAKHGTGQPANQPIVLSLQNKVNFDVKPQTREVFFKRGLTCSEPALEHPALVRQHIWRVSPSRIVHAFDLRGMTPAVLCCNGWVAGPCPVQHDEVVHGVCYVYGKDRRDLNGHGTPIRCAVCRGTGYVTEDKAQSNYNYMVQIRAKQFAHSIEHLWESTEMLIWDMLRNTQMKKYLSQNPEMAAMMSQEATLDSLQRTINAQHQEVLARPWYDKLWYKYSCLSEVKEFFVHQVEGACLAVRDKTTERFYEETKDEVARLYVLLKDEVVASQTV